MFFLIGGSFVGGGGGWYNDGMTGDLWAILLHLLNICGFSFVRGHRLGALVRWCVVGVEKVGSFSPGCILYFLVYFFSCKDSVL